MAAALLALVLGAAQDEDHDKAQRVEQLELVSIAYERTPLHEVLDDLSKQRGIRFVQGITPVEGVTLTLRDAPLQQVCDWIEDHHDVEFVRKVSNVDPLNRWTEVRFRKKRRHPRAHAPGVTFEISRRNREPEGVTLKAWAFGPGRPSDMEWEIAGDDGKPLTVEHCGHCGPLLAFAREAKGSLKVRIKGTVHWDSIYPLVVADSAKQETFRVSGFTVRYEPVNVVITSEAPVPWRRFPRAEFEANGTRFPRGPDSSGTRCGTESERAGWCDCEAGHQRPVISPPAARQKWEVDTKDIRVPVVDPLRIIFKKPMEERFETETVRLSQNP